MNLAEYLSPQRIVFLRNRSKAGALKEMVDAVCRTAPELKRDKVLAAVLEREKTVSSWIGPGIALPHARLPGLGTFLVALGRSRPGIHFDSGDGQPVHLLVLILGGAQDVDGHIMLLADVARTVRASTLVERVLAARSAAEIYRLVLSGGEIERGRRITPAVFAQSRLVCEHAVALAQEVRAKAIMLHVDAMGSLDFLPYIPDTIKTILVTRDRAAISGKLASLGAVVQVPFPGLNRTSQVALSLLFGLSQGLFGKKDRVVGVFGVPESGILDSLMVIDVDREVPTYLPMQSDTPLGDVEPQVLERVLQIATDLAREGREGRSVGLTFVLGDSERVQTLSQQLVINPFRGYRDEERSILDPSLEETIKEFSTIDGAFILRGDGVVLTAGAYLRAEKEVESLPSGLGARHTAAGAVTAQTDALAVVLSQSTGRVSMFKGGRMILSLEPPKQ
jgi:DNA integrity scanning protein DisA with diadenylate cyclase activity/mannitol/fructose-specific phosphotransferase system IIA component (Ntr-type)